MKRFFVLLIVALLIAPSAGSALAQGGGGDDDIDDVCPAIVEAALAAVEDACGGAARDEACYGHLLAEAQARPDAVGFAFDEVGDIVPVADLATLQLSAMDVSAETWGVALMRLRADLPEALPGQSVTLLLFGDVTITNDGGEALPTAEVTAAAGVNLRARPTTNAPVVGSLMEGEAAAADGRLADGSWLRVTTDDGISGWVFADLVTGDVDDLAVVEADTPAAFGPMQAFTFQTGFGDAACAEAPDSGLLIQTPDDAGTVTLRVNDTVVQLGSTAYLQAAPNGDMLIYVLEGQGVITADGVTVTVPAGAFTRVPLDGSLTPTAPPTQPQPYDPDDLPALPLGVLDHPVDVNVTYDPVTPVDDPLAGIGDDDPCTVTPTGAVNLRGGPGVNYAQVGALNAGQAATPDGQASGTDGYTWWRLSGGGWLRSDLVQTAGACDALPVVSTPAPPTAAPTAAPTSAPPAGGGAFLWMQLDNNRPCLPVTPGGDPAASVQFGDTVRFNIGQGTPTQAETEALLARDSGSISINGQVMPSYLTPIVVHVDGSYSYWRRYDWTPSAPGVYSVVGVSEHHGTVACTVTVE